MVDDQMNYAGMGVNGTRSETALEFAVKGGHRIVQMEDPRGRTRAKLEIAGDEQPSWELHDAATAPKSPEYVRDSLASNARWQFGPHNSSCGCKPRPFVGVESPASPRLCLGHGPPMESAVTRIMDWTGCPEVESDPEKPGGMTEFVAGAKAGLRVWRRLGRGCGQLESGRLHRRRGGVVVARHGVCGWVPTTTEATSSSSRDSKVSNR